MLRCKILHRTYYNFSSAVRLGPHVLRLRPRESHELRIEASKLEISPGAELRWYRDVEDNCVAVATFNAEAVQLAIESEVIIQQYNEVPLDFLVADRAVGYPFRYEPEESILYSGPILPNRNPKPGSCESGRRPSGMEAKRWKPSSCWSASVSGFMIR